VEFIFTDRHAYVIDAVYLRELEDLNRIDWPILQRRDFRRDLDDIGKVNRYMAEALIYQSLPVTALSGIICHGVAQQARLQAVATGIGVATPIHARPGWYF
jgi:hypothetical protein